MSDPKRKLAAIVFTDIVGFTKITADDQTLATSLLDKQRDLLKPIVEEYDGNWLKEMGDGLILLFETVTDAVNCCIKIQDTAKNVASLLASTLDTKIKSISLENKGAALKLTSAQFRNLLS